MQSRSQHISNCGCLWRQQNDYPVLITVKKGVKYYGNPEGEHAPFYAIDNQDRLWLTTFYGLEDVELFG